MRFLIINNSTNKVIDSLDSESETKALQKVQEKFNLAKISEYRVTPDFRKTKSNFFNVVKKLLK